MSDEPSDLGKVSPSVRDENPPPTTVQQPSDAVVATEEQNEVQPTSTVARLNPEESPGATLNTKKPASPRIRSKTPPSTGFAPSDINDGRQRYEWESRYPLEALSEIKAERLYLFLLLYSIPTLMMLVWTKWIWGEMGLGQVRYQVFAKFAYAWLGGMLGGTLFDLKWLYHSVAKGMWHQDRHLWRIFTPHISGTLAFSFVLLISSNLLKIFDQNTFSSSMSVVAVSFLVGYFSDSAIAKLTELSETLFGTSRKIREKPSEEPKSDQTTPSPPSKPQTVPIKPRAGRN